MEARTARTAAGAPINKRIHNHNKSFAEVVLPGETPVELPVVLPVDPPIVVPVVVIPVVTTIN